MMNAQCHSLGLNVCKSGVDYLLFVIPDLIGDPWPDAQALDPRFREDEEEYRIIEQSVCPKHPSPN